MRSVWRPLRIPLAALWLCAAPALSAAQTPPASTPPETAPAAASAPVPDKKPDALPVDLSRIEAETKKTAAVRLDDEQLRFYVLVLAKAPKFKFEDWTIGYDLQNGATKGGAAMTNSEFLAMVTPKELKELFGATSGSSFAMFHAAVMNAVGQ